MALVCGVDRPLVGELLGSVETARRRLARELDPRQRAHLGQFLTPNAVAMQMASMFELHLDEVRLLDPGAGIGSLSIALIAAILSQRAMPRRIDLTAFEIDPKLFVELRRTADICARLCMDVGVELVTDLRHHDFLAAAVNALDEGLLGDSIRPFDAVILNPPYRKIGARSTERALVRKLGVETGNLYSAFMTLSGALLRPQGELVAIVPRSFANGPYFRAFRDWFLREMAVDQIHVYESRSRAFEEDAVLQENIILHARRSHVKPECVAITTSSDPWDPLPSRREAPYDEMIRPDDPAGTLRIVPDGLNELVGSRVRQLPSTLSGLGLSVSTGRVVDFRAAKYLCAQPGADTVPLIYPQHMRNGGIVWPQNAIKKANALKRVATTEGLLVPAGRYVLVKRFSSKEEKRRMVAALYDSALVSPSPVAIENHVNYFHDHGAGLPADIALGLLLYLNSTLVDIYFRQFSGHTQVNAGDLRSLRYPSADQLRRLASRAGDALHTQQQLDRILEEELFAMAGDDVDPIQVRHRIDEALQVLRELGLPRAQINERSALTLLALLDLRPADTWESACSPLRGITPMMDFFRDVYGKTYAPNTRETVRRQTVHQFLDAGIVVINPDLPNRPTNSPKAVYQLEASIVALIRTYGGPEWEKRLETYLASRRTLRERYAAERKMSRIPVHLAGGTTFTLSGGGPNVLVVKVLEEFCSRWTPGATILYVGDTDDKFAYFDIDAFHDLGLHIEEHGKMPDVVVHDKQHDWIVLIEAVTSHGPVDPKRRGELRRLFENSSMPLVYVTAFLGRRAMARYLPEIAWETEVWCADAPTHLIHFDGERFLEPADR